MYHQVGYNLNVGGTALVFPINEWDIPAPVTWYQSWSQTHFPAPIAPIVFRNVNIQRYDALQYYRDWSNRLTPGALQPPFRQQDWPNPLPVQWYQNHNWRQVDKLGLDKLPFFNRDWPVPEVRLEPNPRRDWSWRQVDKLGLDILPNRNQYPSPSPVSWFQDWNVNLLQTTLTPTAGTPFVQTDWPNPQPVTWYKEASWRQVDKLGLDILPNRQSDWPLPGTLQWYQNWGFSGYNTQLQPSTARPFVQSDWPLPSTASWYQTFTKSFTLTNPFNQTDWPNPSPVNWSQSWAWRQVDKLGLDILPNRQMDWPNPYPVTWYQNKEFVRSPGSLQPPFNQTDWPLPSTLQWYQWLYNNLLELPLNVQPGTPPYLNFDWPNPRDYARLNDYGYISYVVNPPLPVPPVTPQGGGWTDWTETDVQNQAAFWKKTHQLENYYQNIRTAAQELGKKGGEARMKTMTAFERQSYAKAAAQARWGKK